MGGRHHICAPSYRGVGVLSHLVRCLLTYDRRRGPVGWRVDDHMEADLVVSALQSALQWRRPEAHLIVHSDRGGQYVAQSLKELLDLYQCRQSMSRKANCYDNAFAESFYSRFKTELLEGGAFSSIEDARTEVFDFIEMYYNRKRRHSSIGNQSPLDFETEFYLSLTQHSLN